MTANRKRALLQPIGRDGLVELSYSLKQEFLHSYWLSSTKRNFLLADTFLLYIPTGCHILSELSYWLSWYVNTLKGHLVFRQPIGMQSRHTYQPIRKLTWYAAASRIAKQAHISQYESSLGMQQPIGMQSRHTYQPIRKLSWNAAANRNAEQAHISQ